MTTLKTMRRRALFVMCLSAAVAVDACGNETFSGSNEDAGVDGSTSDAGDAAPNDAATPDANLDASLDAAPLNPDLLASGEDNPNDLVIQNGVLYWTTFSALAGTGGVRSIKADGTGGVKTIAQGIHASRIAIDDTQVYWTDNAIPDNANSFVGISPLAGGGGPSITGTTEPAGIAVDSDSLFIQFSGEKNVNRYTKDGQNFLGTPSNSLTTPVSMAADDIGIFWTDLGLPAGGGQAVSALPDGSILGVGSINGPWGIALDGPNAFMTLVGSDASAGVGGIGVMQRDASTVLTLTNNESAPYFLSVDASYIYWTNEGTPPNYLNGAIRRMTKAGVGATTIIGGQRRPHGIAVDDTYIYWTTYESGEIRRVRKP